MNQLLNFVLLFVLIAGIPTSAAIEETPIGFIDRGPGGVIITSPLIPYEFAGSVGSMLGWQPLAADFDGDGRLDICLPQIISAFDKANEELEELAGPLLIGYGDGSGAIDQFEQIADQCLPGYIAHGDLNADGLADIVTLDCTGVECQLVVWYGLSSREFERKAELSLPAIVHNLQVFDADADGHLDLFALAGSADAFVEAWLMKGDGQGNYAAPIRSSTDLLFIATGQSAAIGDVNGDGIRDVILVGQSIFNAQVHRLVVAYGQGDGRFLFEKGERVLIYPRFLRAGDINGDGVDDICIAHFFDEEIDSESGNIAFSEHESTKATVFLGSSPGGLLQGITYELGLRAKSVFIEDIDTDGYGEVVFISPEAVAIVIQGSAEGLLEPVHAYSAANGSHSQCWSSGIGDLNGDGFSDLFVQLFGQALVVRFGNDNGGFGTGWMAPPVGTDLPINTKDLAGPVDLDRDGHLDLVFFHGRGTGIAFGDGSGRFSEMIVLIEGYQWDSAGIGDFNGDGYEDVIFGRNLNEEGNELRLFLNDKNRTFLNKDSLAFPTEAIRDLVIQDVNEDGYADVLVCEGNRSYLLGGSEAGDLFFMSEVTMSDEMSPTQYDRYEGQQLFTPEFLDTDHDNHVDLVAIDGWAEGGRVVVWKGDGMGGFRSNDTYPGENIRAKPFDLNLDGYLDLIISRGDSGVFTFFGQSDGSFSISEISAGHNASPVGDIDRDGEIDFAMAWGGVLFIYLGPEREPRLQFASHSLGGFSYGFEPLFGDFNEDGWIDIALASDHHISVILNRFEAADEAR
jgi:FG-GAP-like repeat